MTQKVALQRVILRKTQDGACNTQAVRGVYLLVLFNRLRNYIDASSAIYNVTNFQLRAHYVSYLTNS